MSRLNEQLQQAIPAELQSKIQYDVPLSSYTTFKIGGPASALIEVANPEVLLELAEILRKASIPWKLLGGGSNVLVADKGYDGLVIVFHSPENAIKIDENQITAPAGVDFHALALTSVQASLTGFEFAAGIPGTFGGAIYGNAGAFGEQVGDVIESLRVLAPNGETQQLSQAECGFAYRESRFKSSGEIILEATLKLKPGNRSVSQQRIDDIMALRRSKHPDWRRTPCAGSFFRNIEPTSNATRRQAAGAFLDQVGAKQMTVGQAGVFAGHANIIINRGNASFDDIVTLSEQMKSAVFKQFGIELQREVIIWS